MPLPKRKKLPKPNMPSRKRMPPRKTKLGKATSLTGLKTKSKKGKRLF